MGARAVKAYLVEQFALVHPYEEYLRTGTEEQKRRWTHVYELTKLTAPAGASACRFRAEDEGPDLQRI